MPEKVFSALLQNGSDLRQALFSRLCRFDCAAIHHKTPYTACRQCQSRMCRQALVGQQEDNRLQILDDMGRRAVSLQGYGKPGEESCPLDSPLL